MGHLSKEFTTKSGHKAKVIINELHYKNTCSITESDPKEIVGILSVQVSAYLFVEVWDLVFTDYSDVEDIKTCMQAVYDLLEEHSQHLDGPLKQWENFKKVFNATNE